MESSEAGTMDEEVLKLKEKLSQCELQRELLLTEKESWMVNERLVMREKEEAEEKLRVFIEATSSARSEFDKKRKTLKEALETKKKSVHQLNKAIDEFLARPDVNYMGKRTPAVEKFDRLIAEIRKKKMCLQAETDKVDKLHSEILEKRDNLFSFLKTCVKNSEITDVKPVLRLHYDAYVDTLKTDDDDCEMLRKYVHFILQPFVRLDFKSPISAAMSKFFNFFLTKKESNGSRIYNADSTNKDAEPLLSLFYAQPGNSLWKRKADAGFMHCTTMKSFFEETLIAIPDFVLDAPVGAPPSGSNDPFAN